jgi:hypothetical protein
VNCEIVSDWNMKEVEERRDEPTLQSEFCGRISHLTVCRVKELIPAPDFQSSVTTTFAVLGSGHCNSIITNYIPTNDEVIRYAILGSYK